MRAVIIIMLFISCSLSAQDKLFLKDGSVKEGVVLSMGTDFVFFKNSDTSASTFKIPKNLLLMVEKYDGKVFVFGSKIQNDSSAKNLLLPKRNSIGTLPFSPLLGRVTFIYERLNSEGTIGYCPVLVLTFDPLGTIYNASDSTNQQIKHRGGINFIGGGDINFYLGKSERAKFFIGPRLRYGIDMFIGSTEAYSVQTQFGWRLGNPQSRFSQHLSFGFGFVRVLSSLAGSRISPKQSYGWGSVNYRIGVNW